MPQPYDVQHKGCAIICGAAPCVFEDLENARKLRPDATIVGVNNAAAMITEIEHIWTQHPSDAQEYKKAAGKIIYIHSRPRNFDNGAGTWRLVVSDETWESIDYYWRTSRRDCHVHLFNNLYCFIGVGSETTQICKRSILYPCTHYSFIESGLIYSYVYREY
jgi:hypothetical protein